MSILTLAAALVASCQSQEPVTIEVVMRYYYKAKAEPTGLKVELMKNKAVKDVTFDTLSRTAKISFSVKLHELKKHLKKLEDAAGGNARIISHVPVAFTFKPLPGARADLIEEELRKIPNTESHALEIRGSTVEILADLRHVTYGSISQAATNASFEFTLRGPTWVQVQLKKGDIPKITALLEKEDGVLVLTSESGAKRISLWIAPRTLAEERIKEIVEGTMAEIDRIVKY